MALLLAYASSHLSPEHFPWLAIFGITYPIWCIVNIAWVVVWILFRKKYVLLSVICLLGGYNYPGRYIQWNGSPNNHTAENTLKIMSYNVSQFRYNENISQNTTKIMEAINETQPDIVCFQEYHSKKKGSGSPHNLLKNLGYIYYSAGEETAHHLIGSAIYSKHKIQNTDILTNEQQLRKRCLFIDIIYNAHPVRIYNFYLASNHLKKEDAHVIKTITSNKAIEMEQGKHLIRNITAAAKTRSEELRLLVPYLQQCREHFIVCGDWNDTPCSYTYNILHQYGQDAFKVRGKGFGYTFHEATPPQRLDYIMPSKTWKIQTYTHLSVKASDHYPIYSEITLP